MLSCGELKYSYTMNITTASPLLEAIQMKLSQWSTERVAASLRHKILTVSNCFKYFQALSSFYKITFLEANEVRRLMI